MKDYLKEFLAGRKRPPDYPHRGEDKVSKVSKAPFVPFDTSQGVEFEKSAGTVEPLEPEIIWRVQAMLPQIPLTGAIPVPIARQEAKTEKGCCPSCGDALIANDGFICNHCGRATNLAIKEARFNSSVSADVTKGKKILLHG